MGFNSAFKGLKTCWRRQDLTEPDANRKIRRTYHFHSASSRRNINSVRLSVVSATYSEINVYSVSKRSIK